MERFFSWLKGCNDLLRIMYACFPWSDRLCDFQPIWPNKSPSVLSPTDPQGLCLLSQVRLEQILYDMQTQYAIQPFFVPVQMLLTALYTMINESGQWTLRLLKCLESISIRKTETNMQFLKGKWKARSGGLEIEFYSGYPWYCPLKTVHTKKKKKKKKKLFRKSKNFVLFKTLCCL